MSAEEPNNRKTAQRGNANDQRDATLLSDILPLPEPRFHGRIGSTYADSEADIISLPTPPAGAPKTRAPTRKETMDRNDSAVSREPNASIQCLT